MNRQIENINIVGLLNQLAPGTIPSSVFEAIARLVVVPTVVIVPVFRRKRIIRVFLTRRDMKDIHYAGLLHPPGKIMLATDKDLDAVFQRLLRSELPGVTPLSSPVFVGHFFDDISRGKEISMVYFLEISDPGHEKETYEINDLPHDVISTDIPRIVCAGEAFKNHNVCN